MKKRSYEQELMDKGPQFYTHEEYDGCLKQIGTINKYLGADKATIAAIKKVTAFPNSILDVGCGGGDATIRLAQAFPSAKIVGTDISADAIVCAQKQLKAYNTPQTFPLHMVSFQHQPDINLAHEAKSFDIVTTTLVCHHMTDEELVSFLVQARRIARKAVVINDLHRSYCAYGLFTCLRPLIRNRMTMHDGLLSIKRAFKKQELLFFFEQAGFEPDAVSISWHWAFRWVVTAWV